MGSRRVQTGNRPSMLEKRFRPFREGRAKNAIDPKRRVHPAVVIADLRRGVLSSLDSYLRTSRGALDRGVAVELRKLLGGSPCRSTYRLVAIDHPEGRPPKKGRPRKQDQTGPSARQFELVAALREQAALEPKVEGAADRVAEELKVTTRTVFRAAAAVRKHELELLAADAERRDVNQRIDNALARLRSDWAST